MPQASFDQYASRYDEHFTFSPIGLLQRQLVYKKLFRLLNKNKKLLELNCGTGHDAFNLVQLVDSVLATDVSAKMIDACLLKSKNEIKGLRFKEAAIQHLTSELTQINFIFSNFAGLNCISPDEFKTFANNCKATTEKDLELFFVILGRKCIWERFYFLLKLNPIKAFRRKQQNGVTTIIGETSFNTWYYSPREIKQFFGSEFIVESYGPIGLFVPPSYLGPFFENKPKLLKVFGVLDKFFSKFKIAANYGDHFYMHLKKKNW